MSFFSVTAPDIDIQYNGKTYKFGSLTFKDIAKYILWYQYREVEEQREITKHLPEHIRDKILQETHERCRLKRWILKDETTGEIVFEKFLSFETPEVQDSLNTPAGIAYQAYLALNRNHPEVDENLANQICQLKTYELILDKVHQATGVAQEKNLTKDDKLPGEVIPNQ